MLFKSYWRTTVFAAIFLHFFLWLLLALILPYLDFAGEALAVQEMEIVDLIEEESIGEAVEKTPETKKPEIEKPEIEKIEIEKPIEEIAEDILPLETSPTEAAELDEMVAELQKQEEAAKKSGEDDKAVLPPAPPSQAVGVFIAAGNTPDTRGTDFRGTVGILVSIDEQGKVTGYRFTQKSGRTVIDQLVLNAIEHFKFEPALDTSGQPMKTKRLLRFPFDGSPGHAYEDDENKRIRVNRELFLRELRAKSEKAPTLDVDANVGAGTGR